MPQNLPLLLYRCTDKNRRSDHRRQSTAYHIGGEVIPFPGTDRGDSGPETDPSGGAMVAERRAA